MKTENERSVVHKREMCNVYIISAGRFGLMMTIMKMKKSFLERSPAGL